MQTNPNEAANQALLAAAAPIRAPEQQQLQPLVAALREQYGDAVQAIIYYGSCLRRGDPYAGLIDIYVIVDQYRRAHRGWIGALFNGLLPPSVYYLECSAPGGTLRAKVALLNMAHLQRGVTTWFQVTFWARFAQPTALLYARDDDAEACIRAAFGTAVLTLLTRALPLLPERLAPDEAFTRALAHCYACELRVESGQHSASLVAGPAQSDYRRRFYAALPLLAYAAIESAPDRFDFEIPPRYRRQARLAWPLRRMQGKLLSVVRLAKASFTFGGAVDYAVWKIERHTGVAVDVTPRQRRYPLLFGWGLLWRLYRQRTLR